MGLPEVIAEARKRHQCRELARAFSAQFGEEPALWFNAVFVLDANGAPEARLTHNGRQLAVWRDGDDWYIEGEMLVFDDADEARDVLLVVIDDLAPAAAERATVA